MPTKPALLLCLCLFTASIELTAYAAPTADKPPSEPGKTLFETKADASFVLKIGFRVGRSKEGGTVTLHGSERGTGYRLEIGERGLLLFGEGGGKSRELSQVPAAFTAQNSLLLTYRKDLLRVALNGRNVCETREKVQPVSRITIVGKAALWELLEEPRYQPTDRIFLADDFMTTPEEPSRWKALKGTWHIAGVSLPKHASDPFKLIGFADSAAGIVLNTDSRWFWSDYQAATSGKLEGRDSGMGVMFGYHNPTNYYIFSWGGPNSREGDANRLRLCRHEGDRTVVLAEREAFARNGQWYRLSVSSRGGRMSAFVDENEVLTASDPGIIGGQAGLYAAGHQGAEFDDVLIQSCDTPTPTTRKTDRPDSSWQNREFATDPFMVSWGNTQAEWTASTRQGQTWYWHRGYLFESATVSLDAASREVAEVCLFGASEGEKNEGYCVTSTDGKVTLRKAGHELASAASKLRPALVSVDGGRIEVWDEEKKLLAYTDLTPIRSGQVGVRFSNSGSLAMASRGVHVSSPAMVEYQFDSAPADWEIESGDWLATNRWACVPVWNFFGGRGDPIATLWNKREFGGDQWIEAFVAPREGTTDRMHFTFPLNLNITFCAEEEKLGSGYSLVYRIHDQSTVLYRRGEAVAVCKDLILPNWRNDQAFVYARVTQTWQHLQILRQGGRVRVWVEVPSEGVGHLERRLVIDYTDPSPLKGKRLALWSWGKNGIAIARVRIAAEERGKPIPSFLDSPQTTPAVKTGTQLTNAINGGYFRTNLIDHPVEVQSLPVVSFDYRARKDTSLALYAVAGGQRFRASFLGKVSDDGDTVPMGEVESIEGNPDAAKSPNEAGRVSFPLLHALRSFFPSGELPKLEELYVANLSNDVEQLAGLKVNPKGSSFELRTLGAAKRAGPVFTLTSPKDPELTSPEIHIAMTGETADPGNYAFALNGHAAKLGTPCLSWQGNKHEFLLDLTHAGEALKGGKSLRLTIVAPEANGKREQVFSHEWTVSPSADKSPPPRPVVSTSLSPDRVDTFETDLGEWSSLGGDQGASLWRDDSTKADGNCSLRLYHRGISGTFGVVVRQRPFDARRWPILTFSYLIEPETYLNLVCELGGKWYEIRFTDDDNTFPIVGAVQGVKADGNWHDAEVDLLAAVQRSGSDTTLVSKLFFADAGIMNNLHDRAWHVDNFRFVPALPVGRSSVLKWSSEDLSGIAGYSWVFDGTPDTLPDETIEAEGAGSALPAGTSYFHVRAKDSAGNWGPASHFRFVALPDARESAAAEVSHKEGERIAAPEVTVKLTGSSPIDIETIRWRCKVGDRWKEYLAGDGHLTFSSATRLLEWRDPEIPDGAQEGKPCDLTCQLQASNLAGDPVVDKQWHWTVDPALDKTAPAAPFITYLPADSLCRYDFEKGMPEGVELRRSAWLLHEDGNAAVGAGCARAVNLEANDFFSTFLRKPSFEVSRYPRVAFDYRFEYGGCNLNVCSVVNGDMQIVEFAGANGAYPVFKQNTIGAIPGVLQDGMWHHAEFDFGAFLRKRYPDTPRFYADYLGTWSTGVNTSYDNPSGVSLWLDNITIYSPESTSAGFQWQAPPDASGIAGYSYLVDQQKDTVPEEKVMTHDRQCHLDGLKPGAWFFHLRACDRAGNWGPPSHCAFDLTEPKPPQR
ncbi:MAG: fibronectin type III domain-containing protein [Armatimonadetes bacterium]|nr:fibronectin type III domain-containing protein [Armatimonadota bacterium]